MYLHRYPFPADLNYERLRIGIRLNEVERYQTEIRNFWYKLKASIRDIEKLSTLADGVTFVTNWILNNGEEMLNRQQDVIGGDVLDCECLLTAHGTLELECRDTYGYYAELLYKIDSYNGENKNTRTYQDLISQRDFMQFVCRSFATRLERRRNILITSLRFFRLVGEYFENTNLIFDSIIKDNNNYLNNNSTLQHNFINNNYSKHNYNNNTYQKYYNNYNYKYQLNFNQNNDYKYTFIDDHHCSDNNNNMDYSCSKPHLSTVSNTLEKLKSTQNSLGK